MVKQTKVKSKYLRISSKKVDPWLKKFSGLSTEKAEELCMSGNRKIFRMISKLIDSGIAAAEEQKLDKDNLRIKQIICQQGPTMKRRLIKSRGRADIIRKRTCHLVLTLEENV